MSYIIKVVADRCIALTNFIGRCFPHLFSRRILLPSATGMNSPRPSNDSSGKTSSYDRISEDTIRLLLLHPGSGTEELQYELITATFDDMPHYEALSYTWNGNSNWKHIQDAAQSCHLSMNLCASLFALRKPDNNRVLWIDQICINQNDYRERGQQVQLMSKIYSRASKVLIWIGESDEYTQLGFAAISRFAEAQRLRAQPKDAPSIDELDISDMDSVALGSIFNREYYNRAWTVQEIALATHAEVVCGMYSIPWTDFVYISVHLRHAPPSSVSSSRSSLRAIHNISRVTSQCTLLTLLARMYRSSHYECKLGVDRVYALQSLAIPSDRIGVDYSQSVFSVYSAIVRSFITNHQKLTVLSQVQGQVRSPDLSSWVPDWRQDRIVSSINLEEMGCQRSHFCAAGDSKAHILSHRNMRELKLRGILIDVVTCHFLPIRRTTSPLYVNLSEKSDFEAWIAERDSRAKYEHTKEPINSAYFRTLDADQGLASNRIVMSDVDLFWPEYRKWLRNLPHEGPEPTDPDAKLEWLRGPTVDTCIALDDNSLPTQVHDEIWHDIMKYRTLSRRVFHTEHNYIGLGPAETMGGDLVCLLLGASVPFILRPLGSGKFELQGECYVHGIMDGEAFYSADCEKYTDFILV